MHGRCIGALNTKQLPGRLTVPTANRTPTSSMFPPTSLKTRAVAAPGAQALYKRDVGGFPRRVSILASPVGRPAGSRRHTQARRIREPSTTASELGSPQALVSGRSADRLQRSRADPDSAVALDSLAQVYQEQARYSEAEELAKRALAIREKALGESDPAVAHKSSNLAGVYVNQGRYAERRNFSTSA